MTGPKHEKKIGIAFEDVNRLDRLDEWYSNDHCSMKRSVGSFRLQLYFALVSCECDLTVELKEKGGVRT